MQTEQLIRTMRVGAFVLALLAALLTVVTGSSSPANASTAGPLLAPPSRSYAPTLTGGPAGQACGGTVRCVAATGAAYTTVTAAVAAASNGDTIQVQKGTYVGAINAGSKSLTILGGFPTSGWTTRDPAANPSIINANSLGTGILSQSASSFTVDGMQVINGKATVGDFGRYPGSGISIVDAGSATVTHNDVEHNKDGVTADCRCSSGGGINVGVSGSATISFNVVRDNAAQLGGGIALSGSATIEGNLVENNRGESDHGGGMFLAGPDVVVRGNLVRGNGLTGGLGYDGWGGGAIFSGDSATTGTNVGRFEHNTWVGNGVHIDQGGGLFIDEGGKATITGDLFEHNTCARSSGGIYADGNPQSDVTIENVTVIDNACADTSQYGSGIFIQASKASIKNSIVTGNGGASQIDVCPSCDSKGPAVGASSISYSHVGGPVTLSTGAGAHAAMAQGTGMVSTAPTYLNRPGFDYRLADGSSAIDAADPTSSVGNEPNSTRRDIGSYGGTSEGKSATSAGGTLTNTTVPTITGTAKVGSTLTASSGAWTPAPDSYVYAWKAGSSAVGTNATTYAPAAADVGKTITVTVTAKKAGYTDGSATSAATSTVASADGGGGDATPGLPVMSDVWNGSCDAAASGTTYHVGPNQTYTTIAAVPWQSLQPGDRVMIHYRSTPYKEKILLTESGTADHPITICGVPDSSGNRPIIDGNGATTKSTMQSDFDATQYRGLITVAAQEGDQWGYKPKYIVIDGLEVTGAYLGNQFTDYLGHTQAYPHNAAGIFVERGEYITMRNLLVTGNDNGLFVASGNEEATISRHILVDGNHFVGNGGANSDQEHQSYMSAEDIVYQFNHYDDLRSTAGGAALKDRSAGTVVRFNWFNAGSRYLDLVDAQDSDGDANTCPTCLINLPSYRSTYVYGNVLVLNGRTTNPIHYGNDDDVAATSRQGTLYFYGNTLHATHNQDNDVWTASLFDLSSNAESAQIWGNAFRAIPATAGQTPAEWDLTRFRGTFHLGKNAFSPSMGLYRYPPNPNDSSTFSGSVNQTEWNNQFRPTNNDFGFTDVAGGDFKPADGSALIDASATAPVSVPARHALAFQYIKHQLAVGRQVNGARVDLGAYENGPATSVDTGGGGGGGGGGTTSPSTVTLTVTPTRQYYARTVTAKADVSSDGMPATGSVAFAINGTTVRTATLTNGTASIVLPYTTTAGTKTVTASYAGNAMSDPASANAALTILRAPSTIAAKLAATTIHSTSQAKVYNAVKIYKGASGVYPTGYVTVRVDSKILAKVKIYKGQAIALLPRLPIGNHKVQSSYLGSTNVAGSISSSMILTVVR